MTKCKSNRGMNSELKERGAPPVGLGAGQGPVPSAMGYAVQEGGRAATKETLRLENILVPVDFSAGSLKTLNYAAALRDAELLALTAVREHCDLIVVYSHSGSLRQRLMAGRLADEVAGMASCPVLCLPEADADGIENPAKASWWTRLMQAHLEVPREDDRD